MKIRRTAIKLSSECDDEPIFIVEYGLLWEVLLRAVLDCLGLFCNRGSRAQLRQAAQFWIKEENPEDIKIPFTFLWLCSELDIEPERVRNFVRENENKPHRRDLQQGHKVVNRYLSREILEMR